MKINPYIQKGTGKSKITPKKTEKGPADKVVLGQREDSSLLMGDKLKGIKSSDDFENWVAETLADGIEHQVKVFKYANTGRLIGAGTGIAAGITGALLGTGAGAAGAVVGGLLGGAGGLFLGGEIGKALAKVTPDKDEIEESPSGNAPVKPQFISSQPVDTTPKVKIPEEISSLANAGLKAMDDVKNPGTGLRAGAKFLDTILENTNDSTIKVLAECAKKIPSDSTKTRFAAYKGVYTALTSRGLTMEQFFAKAGLTAVDSVNKENLYKEKIGANAAKPFLEAIEATSKDDVAKTVSKAANKIDMNMEVGRYAAYKGALTAINSGISDKGKALSKAGLVTMDSVGDNYLHKEEMGVKGAKNFVDAIAENTENETHKLIASAANALSEPSVTKQAAYKGALTAIAYDRGEGQDHLLAKAGLEAVNAVGDNYLHKEEMGVKAAEAFIKLIEEKGENEAHKSLASAANTLSEPSVTKQSAYKGALIALTSGMEGSQDRLFAKAGLEALKGVGENYLYKKEMGVRASEPFMRVLEAEGENDKVKLVAEKSTVLTKASVAKYAALAGGFSAIASGMGLATSQILAKAGLTTLESIEDSYLYKESMGVGASKPFMEAIEEHGEKKKDRLLSKTANEMGKTEFDKARYKAFKSTFQEILR